MHIGSNKSVYSREVGDSEETGPQYTQLKQFRLPQSPANVDDRCLDMRTTQDGGNTI